MEPKKTSKKISKTADASVAPMKASEPGAPASKPVKRATAAKPSAPKKTATSTYRHSKLAVPPSAPSSSVSVEEVAKLAYQYWEERHHADGFADQDWHRAEKALSAKA